MTATSGRKCCGLLPKHDPLGHFSRTFLVTYQWASTKCYLTWKPKATPRGALLFQLAPSMPRTDETEFGLLGTPSASTGGAYPVDKEKDAWTWKGSYWIDDKGAKKQSRLIDQIRMWPTAQARDWKGPSGRSMKGEERDLPQAARTSPQDGQLNPTFVEWLMGYPSGWTELED